MGKYPVNDKGDDDRIRDRDFMKLNGKDYDERALAFAYLNAKFGRKALKHIVVSYREGPVSLEMAERHRDTFLRVLGAENCAGFYGLHGDTDHPHFYLALCAYDLTDENLDKWGQGFEIEAIHIALALCERDDMMPCEPNRRYVADKSGVYHTLSGIKVADKDGHIYRSTQMLRIPGLQHKMEQHIRTPDGLEEGAAVPADASIKILGRAALECAHDWGSFHQGLARVGLRYELYEAAGEIIGGYLVPIDAESGATPRVKASEIGAGYKKLVGKFGDVEYQQPPSDLWFRPFQTLGYVGKPELEIEADEREKQRRLAEDEGLKNFKAEIASRHHDDGLSSKAVEKAREAKKRKRSLPSPGVSEDALKNEDASYRAHERNFADGLDRTLTQERGEKRGRPRKEPVEALIWGAATSIEHDARPLAKRYFAIRSEGRRSFYDGELLAFSETRNFVALHSNRQQHQIDALLLAHKKFGAIRIKAPRKQRRQLVKLAIEYGNALDGSHQAEVRMINGRAAAVQLLIPPRLRQRSAGSRSMSSNSPAPDSERNATGVSLDHPLTKEARLRRDRRLRLADLRYQSQRDGRERKHRCSLHFPSYSIPWMEERNEAALEARGPNPPPNEANLARRKLEAIDRNELMLVSSVGEHHEYRFLDDQRLLAAFSTNKRWLLFADIQNRLRAMAAIQAHERRWVAVASKFGRIKVEKEGLMVVDKTDDWRSNFTTSNVTTPGCNG
ncbi:polyprotein [Qipengyuania citrea LAMA 915]|uniref:Polyprotein n=2 Tax=Qipengyuania citrea TaxID=225971 RepID=A0A0L1KHN9_9SPHN|nr:polyprotein [Qipengyuania citrea LAMA 915]